MTPEGRMTRRISPEDQKRIKGHIPFYSVDTVEEAEALIEAALACGEFARKEDGTLVETTLMYDQTPANLTEAGERLAAIHKRQCHERHMITESEV